jgi:hypothetical protein
VISNGEAGDLNRTGTVGEFLGERLVAGYLAPQYRNPRFTTVPSDSPALHHAMEKFAEMLHHDDKELLNGWGAVIITDEQANMKRLDVIISWDQVELTDTGAVVLGENGEPIPVLDENGVQIRRWYVDHIFINENSAYFD